MELTNKWSGASVTDLKRLVTVEWNGKNAVGLGIDGDRSTLCDDANHSCQSTARRASQRQL